MIDMRRALLLAILGPLLAAPSALAAWEPARTVARGSGAVESVRMSGPLEVPEGRLSVGLGDDGTVLVAWDQLAWVEPGSGGGSQLTLADARSGALEAPRVEAQLPSTGGRTDLCGGLLELHEPEAPVARWLCQPADLSRTAAQEARYRARR